MMSKFKDYGIMHLDIECDIFVAHKDLYTEPSAFLTDAIRKEDCGWELAHKNNCSMTDIFYKFIPFVKDDAYIVHRIGYWFQGETSDPHYEFVKSPGRGHVRVWYIDIEEVEKSLKDKENPHEKVDSN